MRRDKDCPYKSHCHDAPECCPECDWHLTFEKFRRRIVRMENRLSRANAMLEMYRGVAGCRLNEMMDAELEQRCLTLAVPTHDDIADFKELYGEFMEMLRDDPPVPTIMGIAEAIEQFLDAAEKASYVREHRAEEDGENE